MTGVLIRRGYLDTDTYKEKAVSKQEECCLQAKQLLRLPEARREA